MKKSLFLLVFAASMMLCSCGKVEKDAEAPENSMQIFNDVECSSCHTHYTVKGQTWDGSSVVTSYVQHQEPSITDAYAVYTIPGNQFVPFSVSNNGRYIKWNCVGNDCGKELKLEFDSAVIKAQNNDGPMPQTREHILL